MMKHFWIETSVKNSISYDNFFQDLLKEGHNHFVVQDDNPYRFFEINKKSHFRKE